MKYVLLILFGLVVGCGGAIESAQTALNVSAVVVDGTDEVATTAYKAAIALATTERAMRSVAVVFEPVRDALEVVYAALIAADYALDLWREGVGSAAFFSKAFELFGAMKTLLAALEAAGVSAPDLHTAMELLSSVLNATP